MKALDKKDPRACELCFCGIEIFPEAWTTRRGFAQYANAPRPKSALFFICEDVEASFVTEDGKTVIASRGDVIYIPTGARYRARIEGRSGNAIETYTVNFTLKDESGCEVVIFPTVTKLGGLAPSTAKRYCEEIAAALHRAGGEQADRLKATAKLYALVDELFSQSYSRSDEYYPIRAGVEALRAEWNKNERIEKYAELCGISCAHFYNCFRACFGKSPVEYRTALRISDAENMLSSTDMRISEIARVVGYDDPFYFCRVFKEKTGVSPKKYRERARETLISENK